MSRATTQISMLKRCVTDTTVGDLLTVRKYVYYCWRLVDREKVWHSLVARVIERFCLTHNTKENCVCCLGTMNANVGFACAAGRTYVTMFVLIWQMYGVSIACVGCPRTLFLSLMTMIVKPKHFESTGPNS